MRHIFIIKHGFLRAAMTLALIMTCATAWAQSSNFTDDGNDTYTIHNATGWGEFCDALQDNDTYNRFSGKTVKLGANISVTRMAGGSEHDMKGIFDGQGYTLTVSYGTAGSPISEDKVAPFRNVEYGCTIKNLHVAGDIYTSGKNAAGIAGTQFGAVTIRNCRVSTTIHSYTSGDGTHGGLVGNNGNGENSALTIEGCVFDGNLLTEGPTATIKCGGFVGWHSSERTVNISNSLYAPATLGTGKAEPTNNSATFCRNGITTLTNCYYTRTLGDEQGLLMRSITAGDNVTIDAISPVGEATATYNVSGITAYTKGITRTVDETTTFYYGQDDDVSLMLGELPTGNAPAGYNYAYTASAGTLTGNDNPYTLTMPNEDVTISIALRSTGMAVSVSYINENGETQTINAVALDGTKSELNGSAYYVGTDINYTNRITFKKEEGTILILGDGATMTVNNTDYAIYTHGNLTICGQALGTGKLNANNANTNSSCIYTSDGTSITINGGTVTATGGSYAIRSYYDVIINGGTVTATGGSCAVWADYDVTINGGNVTATGGSSAIQSTYSGVTINGGNVTATGNGDGIIAGGTITLGWKNASDHIYANSYITSSSYVSVKDSQKLTDEDGNTYSGNVACSAIASKTLYPEIVIFYLDENGQGRLCINYTTLTSNTTSLGTAGQETWYVVDGSINFTSTISTAGDVHLILKDNAVMNVGTEESPIQDNGIGDNNSISSISIYGQSTGENQGQLFVYSTGPGIYAKSGDFKCSSAKVTVLSFSSHGIWADANSVTGKGNITIRDATVNATGHNALYAMGGNLTINGGQVTANGVQYGIYSCGNIALGWTNLTDYIYANSYFTNGTLSLTKTFIDEDGTTHTPNNIGTIDGKTLYPEGVIFYLDENGQRQLCTNYTTLTSDTTSFGTVNQETWFVVDGSINFTSTISTAGDVHLILKDNAVMNVGTDRTSINGRGNGIEVGGHTLIYAQSTGAVKGQLNVNHYTTGIRVYKDLTINGGQVTVDVSGEGTLNGIWSDGSVTINGGSIHVSSNQYGIKFRNSLTINGGQVSATGTNYGIYALNSNVTLSWTNPTDYIYANSYDIGGTLTLTKTFIDDDGHTYSGTIAMENETYPINGKTLRPEGVIIKQVIGYGNSTESDHWVFIASPVAGSLAPSEVHNLLGSYDEDAEKYDYDLYRFNQSADKEWENYNNPAHTAGFKLVNGMGYLYASKEDRTLVFAGEFNTDESKQVTLQQGWNLVGNPFVETAYIAEGLDFYVMNADGSEIIAAAANQNNIAPMEGIIVYAEDGVDKVTFCTQVPGKGHGQKPEIEQLVLNLSRPSTGSGTGSTSSVIDRTIVRFGESQTLPKFQIRENSTKLYIPQGGKDYAIATSNGQGEMPLNFRAKENGEYTITVNPENVEMAYLHLIDNMTGADIDLLPNRETLIAGEDPQSLTPSYTFTAKTTDYESRFKLVFAVGPSTGSGTFAFISNGNLIVNGEGMLQIMDMTGRMIRCTDVARNVSTSGMVPGVYVLRLINGKNIRTQKMVIR